MRRLFLLLCLPFLMGQTLRDVTVRDVVLGSAGGASNESVPVTITTGVTVPAGGNYWRCVSFAEANGNDCARDIDDNATYTAESWQSYDGNSVCNDENVHPTTEEVKIDFDTPSSNPTATASAQTIRVTFDQTNATCAAAGVGTDPTVDVYVWDGNSLETLVSNLACDDAEAGDQEYSYNFTYEGASDGSEVYVEIFDDGNGLTGTSRRRCAVEYIEWYAEVN